MKNASSVHVGLRIPAQIFEAVKTAYPNFGWSKIVREALVEKLGRDKGITFDDSVLCMSQGSRNDLPNRITEAEKRARKGLRPRGRPRKLRMELGGGGSSGLIPARIDADGELRPLVPVSEPRESSSRESA